MDHTGIATAHIFPAGTEAEWRRRVDQALKGADFDARLVRRTADGLALPPLHHGRADAEIVAGRSVGRSAAGRPWRIMARVDHPIADDAARLALEDLEGGADALALVFPGGRSARGFGLPCETVADLDAALAGVRLDLVDLRIDPAPAGHVNALMLAALVERRKLNPAGLRIDFGLDPASSLLTVGHVPWDWPTMAERLRETVLALKENGFAGPFLTVDLRPCHEAGATEGQELAAALAGGVLYLRVLEHAGLSLEEASRAISFVVPVDGDQFSGVAKLRALRKLWSMVERWSEAAPQPATIHAETSWRMMTRRDAHVNILRASVAAFAAGVAGADSLTVLPFTQTLGLPDAAARRLARNTSLVLLEEASLARVVDPAAGAGGVEALTDALCEKAWELFREIEGEGGLLISLVAGKLQARIAEARAARMKAIATRREPLTGTSEFAHLAETPPEIISVSLPKRKAPKARAKAKFGPGTPEVIAALAAGASRADASPPYSGELKADALVSYRWAEPFEALRDRADAHLATTGARPGVTLATLGEPAGHAARLAFTRNFFEAGGLEVVVADVAAVDVGARLVCLVGSDAVYAETGAKAARKLKAKGRRVWLAGRPGEAEATLTKAGVTRFVFLGSEVVGALADALTAVAKR
jgi:methylmalonyl-CoA mutase